MYIIIIVSILKLLQAFIPFCVLGLSLVMSHEKEVKIMKPHTLTLEVSSMHVHHKVNKPTKLLRCIAGCVHTLI